MRNRHHSDFSSLAFLEMTGCKGLVDWFVPLEIYQRGTESQGGGREEAGKNPEMFHPFSSRARSKMSGELIRDDRAASTPVASFEARSSAFQVPTDAVAVESPVVAAAVQAVAVASPAVAAAIRAVADASPVASPVAGACTSPMKLPPALLRTDLNPRSVRRPLP